MNFHLKLILLLNLFTIKVSGQSQYLYNYEIKNLYSDSISKAYVDTTNSEKGIVEFFVHGYISQGELNTFDIKIHSKDTSITKEKRYDVGNFSFNLKPNNYTFTIDALFYIHLDLNVNISKGAKIYVKLAQSNFQDTYTIHSKKPLSENEIFEIRKCLFYKKNSTETCKTRKYYVTENSTGENIILIPLIIKTETKDK